MAEISQGDICEYDAKNDQESSEDCQKVSVPAPRSYRVSLLLLHLTPMDYLFEVPKTSFGAKSIIFYLLGLLSSSIIRDEPARFPLHRLPAEIVHMIFGYLTPTEIASMRSMSSNIAAIGLKHIARTVTVTLQEDSFDRLLDIAHHPVVSKSVRNLCYEYGSFSSLPRTKWEESIITPKAREAQSPSEDIWIRFLTNEKGSDRGLRAFRRECNAAKACNTYDKKRLDQAFSVYQKHCAEEDRARRSYLFLDKLISAIRHFSKLETIYILSGSCRRYKAELAKVLKGASYVQLINHVYNIPVTFSILDAVDRVVSDTRIMNGGATNVDNEPGLIARTQDPSTASDHDLVWNEQVNLGPGDGALNRYCPEFNMPGRGQSVLRIRHLVLKDFDWRILLDGVQVFSTLKRCLFHLTKLEIHLLTGTHNESSKVNDHLHHFVKLAPGLEEFSVSLHRAFWPLRFVGLPDVVGSFHWTSLKTVHFSRSLIDADNLQDFCSRHSSTLSNFFSGNVDMAEHARAARRVAWHSMFTKIRETTNLEKARVYGCLGIAQHEYYMEDRKDRRRATGTLIARYLVGEGGRSSLERFMEDERPRISRQDKTSYNDAETEWSESSTSDGEDSSSEEDA